MIDHRSQRLPICQRILCKAGSVKAPVIELEIGFAERRSCRHRTPSSRDVIVLARERPEKEYRTCVAPNQVTGSQLPKRQGSDGATPLIRGHSLALQAAGAVGEASCIGCGGINEISS